MSSYSILVVNDIHSQLNPIKVADVVTVTSLEAIQAIVVKAAEHNQSVSIAGGRHAMGGQQFGTDTILIDTTQLNRVLNFNRAKGLIEVEAGIQWPKLIDYLVEMQKEIPWSQQWSIAQKQTGADRLSIGGSLACNAHGRGLKMRPIIADVDSFILIDAQGKSCQCSRQENSDLFRLAIGGYGLFGVIYSVTLRLIRRQKLERVVELIKVDKLPKAFEQRIQAGFLYGDFQFSTDEKSDDFLQLGVFSCYRQVDPARPITKDQKELSVDHWNNFCHLSHADKGEAFRQYASYYLFTSGQIYASDTHQLSFYLDNYHHELDRPFGATQRATEITTEIYVPRIGTAQFFSRSPRGFSNQYG